MRRDLPSLHALAAFEAAASQGSFTKAAGLLNVQQPAVSRQVAALEQALGCALFRRKKPRLELSDAGRRLLATLASGFDAIQREVEVIRRQAGGKRLVVDTSIGMASCWLIARLAHFRRAYPEIDIELVTRDRDPEFDLDRSDIVLRFGEGNWPGVEATEIFREEVFPVCSPAYLAGRAGELAPADLPNERLLHFDDGYYRWLDWAGLLRGEGVEVPGPLPGPSFNSFIVLVQATLNGEGIALGWGRLMEDALQSGALVRPTGISLRSARGYHCVVRDTAGMKPEAAIFRDWLLSVAA